METYFCMVPKEPVQAQVSHACVDFTEPTWAGVTSVGCMCIFAGQGVIMLITVSGWLQSLCGFKKRPFHPNGLGIEALKRMARRPEHLPFPSSPCHTRGMISPFPSLQFTGVGCVPRFEFASHVLMSKVSLVCSDASGVMRIADHLPHTAILKIRLGNGHEGPCNVPGNSQNHGCSRPSIDNC